MDGEVRSQAGRGADLHLVGTEFHLRRGGALDVALCDRQRRSGEGDLHALGACVTAWVGGSPSRKLAKAKPLQSILQRLGGDNADQRYATTAALLADLDGAGSEVPPNPEAWERLLRHVRENMAAEAPLRRTA